MKLVNPPIEGPKQPSFVEEIVTALLAEHPTDLPDLADYLVVNYPDYSRSVGVGDNLYRTTVRLSKPNIALEDLSAVHISNILRGEQHDTITVLFEEHKNGAIVNHTRWYQPALAMRIKQHLVSNLGYRSREDIHKDILEFLRVGKIND